MYKKEKTLLRRVKMCPDGTLRNVHSGERDVLPQFGTVTLSWPSRRPSRPAAILFKV